ncbi:MAG TPA: 30S ribosomal protein S7 [Candidatus Woesearchaeota archaeon]|nr:30S ribosomal protein S7 [Candidatus Woesearchaeota archaeon]
MVELKLFGLYNSTGIEVKDPGLREYITLKPVYAPKSFGRYEHYRFHKSKMHIVERLINKLMTPGHKGKKHFRTSEFCTGKSATCTDLVKKTFRIILEKTKKNPVEVLVRAVEYAAPREEVTVIEMGGTRIPKQVDTAPQRRIDVALRWITQGAFQSVMNKKTPIEVGLANEIIAASENDTKSFAVSKSSEMERQATASR